MFVFRINQKPKTIHMSDSKKSYFDLELFLTFAAALFVVGLLFAVFGGVINKHAARLTGTNPDGSNFDKTDE